MMSEKNNSKQGLQNISKFVNKCNHTNVIVMTVPHRHDLISQSCVNKEVSYFNRQLKRRLKPFGNVSVIDVDTRRDLYTRHGLHLNGRGKEIVASQIVEEIERKLRKNATEAITMGYGEAIGLINERTAAQMEASSDEGAIRRSERSRRPPQKLSTAFL